VVINGPNPIDAPVPTARLSTLAALRLIAAYAVTVFLAYVWGRVLVIYMQVGQAEPLYKRLLGVGIVAIMALTFGLPAALGRARLQRLAAWSLLLAWMMMNGLLVALYTDSTIPKRYVLVLFILSSLWVPWIAWIFFWPLRWPARLAVLAACIPAAGLCPWLLRVEGLSGDAHVSFGWRNAAAEAGPDELSAAASGTADLGHTTDHDFPQFLGPERLAVVRDARLARDWAKTPPQLVWQRRIGGGWSSFAVVGDYAVTQEQRESQECVVCYRVADGSPVWVHADPIYFGTSLGGPGPRATPTIAAGRVYTIGATGLLNCLDGATGRPVWSVNILDDNQAENIAHGVCASPLVVDDKVIVCPTWSNGQSLAAYHRDTGHRLWQAGRERASYSSPLLAELAGVRQILLYNSERLTAHDPASGRILWEGPSWTNTERVISSQPIPNAGAPGQVFLSNGYGKGSMLLRIEHAGADWSVRPLWQSNQMKTKFTTPVVRGDFVYGLDDGILECVSLKDGRKVWKEGRYQHGQVLLAGDLLLVQAENGDVVLVEPVPERLRELGRFSALNGKTWNNPALAGRFLLVRNDHESACYELPLEPN
jgi:outer membrane protein assembly factor BamB